MEKCIRYIDGVEWVELPYSDETLVTELKKRVGNVGANTISMWFSENKKNHGTIYVSIQNLDVTNNYRKIVNHDTLYLHDICLETENWKDNLREYQREKGVIKRNFPLLKVTSNFR